MEKFPEETILIRCLLCGSESDSSLMFFNGFRIARCAKCEFVFVNPRPTEESLSRLYANREQNPYFSDGHEPLKYEWPVLLKLVRHIQRYIPRGKLLEVGCGRGDLLAVAQSHGFSVTGCDFFDGKTSVVEGAVFREGPLKRAGFPDNCFDVIVTRNTLEHVFDPNEEIKEITRILKPKGFLYVKVPNVDYEHGIRCRLLFRKEHAFEAPYHLNHFSPISLQRFLKNARLEIVSWYPEQPTLSSKWTVNLFRQTGYRAIYTTYRLSAGKMFPKVVLSCLAQKPA